MWIKEVCGSLLNLSGPMRIRRNDNNAVYAWNGDTRDPGLCLAIFNSESEAQALLNDIAKWLDTNRLVFPPGIQSGVLVELLGQCYPNKVFDIPEWIKNRKEPK